MNARITPLHVRSGYSMLRGPSPPSRLLRRARQLGHTHLALTDVNSLAAATFFHRRALKAGLRPLIGAELQGNCEAAVALVAEDRGYENLCRIITGLCGQDGASLASLLAAGADGLYVIADETSAESLLAAGLSRDRLLLGIDPACQSRGQLYRLEKLSRRLHLPSVATGRAMMAEKAEHDVARLLAAIRLGKTWDTVPVDDLPPAGACLRSSRQLARELAEFPQAVTNNRRLVEACSAFRLLPREVVFPAFESPDALPPATRLRQLCREGIAWRYRHQPPAGLAARLDRELRLIETKGFSAYFLVVWDIVRHARRRGAPVAGRGSGAGSLVAYLLGITNACPLKYDLPFERFLNECRTDFPDLDIDLCWRIRDDVIDYAFRRWGNERVAMVSTHNTFQPRSALRETAKAFGLSDRQISRLVKDPSDPNGLSSRIAALSRCITDLPHNFSVHPGGIVITPKPIDQYVPVQPAAKAVTLTQYDKRGIEDIGLVKLDLLGNRSLSTIRSACELIRHRRGRRIDVEALPADDATLKTLQRAETVGCNQLESPAMRHLLRALRPNGIRDVMKALALIRPGAASIGMKETFIRRQRGLEKPPSVLATIDALLSETNGVMVYEDDVMLVGAALLGCSPAEGDRFRKAVQNCSTDRQRLKLSGQFLARCRARGVPDAVAKDLWVQMAKFNAYSFCRAHAASYARLAWAVAYLKTHYPLEFWTGALNNNQSMYHPRVYVEQAKRGGIVFKKPDVNRSEQEFSIDDDAIRVGFNCVGGLGPAGASAILEAQRRRAFDGLSDFLHRTGLGEQDTRALILCGAFDAFGRTRPQLMMEMHLCLQTGSKFPSNQVCLLPVRPVVPNVPADYDPWRKYFDERRILGLSVGPHIMTRWRDGLAGRVDVVSRDLPSRAGQTVRIAGVLEALRTTTTRRGETMSFLTMDDEYGLFEVTVFPGAQRRGWASFSRYGPYVVTGRVEVQYDHVTIAAERVSLWRSQRARVRS